MARFALLSLLLFGISVTSSAVQASVIVTNSYHQAQAYHYEYYPSYVYESDYDELQSNAAVPLSYVLSATAQSGAASATNLVTRTPTLGGYTFLSTVQFFADVDNIPPENYYYYYRDAYGYANGQESFTVDADTPYSLRGLISATDSGFDFRVYAYLFDQTLGQTVVEAYNYLYGNQHIGSATVELGGPGPNSYLYGSLDGMLIAGHSYFFNYYSYAQDYQYYYYYYNYDTEDNGISANGFVRLQLGTTEVPEPASLALWGLVSLAGAGTGWYRQRRRQAA